MKGKLLAWLAMLPLAWPGAPAQGLSAQQPPVRPLIDSMTLRAATYFLAHDLLEGRGTGRRGNEVAGLYLATEAARLGLVGAGSDRTYFQPVPMVEAEVDPAGTGLVVTSAPSQPGAPPTSEVFAYPDGFIPNIGTGRSLTSFGGELVYAGSARDLLTRPERLPAPTGRVALLRGLFGPDAAAADTLRARGVRGVVHLVGDSERFALYLRSRGRSRMYLAEEAGAVSSFIPDIPAVIASPALERVLLAGAPGTDSASGDADRPFVMAGRRIEVTIGVHPRAVSARNVAALLVGADAAMRSEVVLYTAHYDHLGISTADARGDSIYNGFSDNAAGSAMLLAIAKLMTEGPRPRRSVLFLWLTGEERGLLGSDYFAAHPLVPAHRIVGAINLDAGAPPAPSVAWRIAGGEFSTLGQVAAEVARRAGWQAQAAPASPNSDYFPLLRIGVPAVFLIPGPGPFEGLTTEASQALRRRWNHYHEASDHWAPDFPFRGLVRYADFAYRLGVELTEGARPRMPTAR